MVDTEVRVSRYLAVVDGELCLLQRLTGQEKEVIPVPGSDNLIRLLDRHFHCFVRRRIPHRLPQPE